MQQMAASNTIIQTIVDEDKRGRVMSFYTVAFVGMAPFGSLLAGAMAHAMGAPRTVMVERGVLHRGRDLVCFATEIDTKSNSTDLYQSWGFCPSRR